MQLPLPHALADPRPPHSPPPRAGVPTQIAKHPDGDILDMAAIIRDVLSDNDHVVVTPSLSGDGDEKS